MGYMGGGVWSVLSRYILKLIFWWWGDVKKAVSGGAQPLFLVF